MNDDLSSLTFIDTVEEFKSISNLQATIFKITPETMKETINEIITSKWIASQKKLMQFVHSCVLVAEYRPKQIETVAILISKLMKYAIVQEKDNDTDNIDTQINEYESEDNKKPTSKSVQPNYLPLLPSFLITTIFRGLYYTKPFPKESSHLCFLFNCFKRGVFPILDIIHQIKIFSKD